MSETMFTVSSGLLAPKHIAAMGPALAEFLCLIDWQTDMSGRVKGGVPIKVDEISKRLGRPRRTTQRNLDRLQKYLDVTRTRHGLMIRIRNPKKWFRNAESWGDKSGASNKTIKKNTVEQKTLDGSCRNFDPTWFEEFWKLYPSNRGSKKAGFAQAKKAVKSDGDTRAAIDILNRKADHIRRMQAAGKWVASLPHVERYFRKGLWEQPLDREQTELDPVTYGRPVSRAEIEAGNRQIAEWKRSARPNGPVEVTA